MYIPTVYFPLMNAYMSTAYNIKLHLCNLNQVKHSNSVSDGSIFRASITVRFILDLLNDL